MQAHRYANYQQLDPTQFVLDIFEEKFAELIVRDCASICDQQGRVGWNDDRKAQAKLDRDLIKEHFGVE
jgi:alpha-amylase/alpha-mannosidase (GH57 family)